MSLALRDVSAADLPALRRLNESEVPHVNSIPIETFEWFTHHAAYFRVAELGAELAGFLIGLTPEADYPSLNFRWFRAHYQRFMYIDRIVVATIARRRGLGRLFYDDLARTSRGIAPRLTCEVNLRPQNDGSMRFHLEYGFAQVGTQETEGGAKQVALMAKEINPQHRSTI